MLIIVFDLAMNKQSCNKGKLLCIATITSLNVKVIC